MAMENPHFQYGMNTSSEGPFSIAMLVYHRIVNLDGSSRILVGKSIKSTVITSIFQVRCHVVFNSSYGNQLLSYHKKVLTWQFQICPFKEKPGVIRTSI